MSRRIPQQKRSRCTNRGYRGMPGTATSLPLLVVFAGMVGLACHRRAEVSSQSEVQSRMPQFVLRGDVRLRLFSYAGDGIERNPVLAIHGGPGVLSREFEQRVALLAALGAPVFWYRQRGIVPSTRSSSDDYSMIAYARDAASVARAIGKPPLIVAFSFGAFAAIDAVSADPHLARGLVLVNPPPPTLEADDEVRRIMRENLSWHAATGGLPADWSEAEGCDAVYVWATALDAPPREYLRFPMICDDDLARRTSAQMGAYDARGTFQAIETPTLIVRGEHDVFRTVLKFEDLGGPSASYAMIESCGHFLLSESGCAQQLVQSIAGWLDRQKLDDSAR